MSNDVGIWVLHAHSEAGVGEADPTDIRHRLHWRTGRLALACIVALTSDAFVACSL